MSARRVAPGGSWTSRGWAPPGWTPFLALAVAAVPAAGQDAPPASAAPTPPRVVEPFRPDTVLTPPSGPRIVRLPAPGSPLVSLRLSIPLTEAPVEAGAGRILQMLGTERARALASPVGARVEGARTPWGIAYTVTGAAADIDFLAFLLREAVRDPANRRVDFRQALDTLRSEAERRRETPGGRIAAELRRAANPAIPPLGGTAGSLARMTLGDVHRLWSRTHVASRMTLVAAGDVPVEVLLASFQPLGVPAGQEGSGAPEAPVPEAGRARTQVLRYWYGEARRVDDPVDPRAEVAALLVAESLEAERGSFEADVELWQLPGARVLTVVGAAYASGRQEMRRRVQGALARTADGLSAASVEAAVSRIRADLLMEARTPPGRAGLVGLRLDATGEVGAAQAYLDALGAVTLEDQTAFLRALADRTPLQAEVRP